MVGGVCLGLAESAATRYLGEAGIPGLRYVVVLGVLLAVLLGRQTCPQLTAPARPAGEHEPRPTAAAA